MSPAASCAGIVLRYLLTFSVVALLCPLSSQAIDAKHLGACGDLCNCQEYTTINDGDGDEKFPLDEDSRTDTGSNYLLQGVAAPSFNPNRSEVTVKVEAWSKDPQEILDILLAEELSPSERALYQFLKNMRTAPGTGNRLAEEVFPGLVSKGHATGPYRYGDGNVDPHGTYWGLKVGTRQCFLQRGWYDTVGFSGLYRWGRPMGNYGGSYAKLIFCVAETWQNGNPRTQLNAYFNEGRGIQNAVAVMDFVVGMTPFLNTADLVFNQKILTDIKDGKIDKLGQLCGAVAGDFFVAAKVVNRVKDLANASKILQVAAFSSGCGSTLFSGGYLFNKGLTQGMSSQDYGQAAFLGIEIVGLILDRPAQELVKRYVSELYYRAKKPATSCLLCGPKCPPGKNALPTTQIDEALSLPDVVKSATCSTCSLSRRAKPPDLSHAPGLQPLMLPDTAYATHGTTTSSALDIISNGVKKGQGKGYWGEGLYLTPSRNGRRLVNGSRLEVDDKAFKGGAAWADFHYERIDQLGENPVVLIAEVDVKRATVANIAHADQIDFSRGHVPVNTLDSGLSSGSTSEALGLQQETACFDMLNADHRPYTGSEDVLPSFSNGNSIVVRESGSSKVEITHVVEFNRNEWPWVPILYTVDEWLALQRQ